MSAEHTPGPWKTTGLNVRASDGGLICTAANLWADQATPQDVKEANARLIAAAPRLFDAVNMTLIFCDVVAMALLKAGDINTGRDASMFAMALRSILNQSNLTERKKFDGDPRANN